MRGPTSPLHSTKPCALLLAALALSMIPARASAGCKLGSLEMPVTLIGSRAAATLAINGKPVRLTVDTGSFYSMLTPAAAEQLKLRRRELPDGMRIQGLTGVIEADRANVSHLQFGAGELTDIDFIVGGNEPGGGTLGLLGRNILGLTDVEYDLAHGVIRLMFPKGDCDDTNLAYWAGGQPVAELALQHDNIAKIPAISAIAKLNGKELIVEFDTGAMTMVSLEAAQRAGVRRADMTPAGPVYGSGRGSADSWTASFGSFELGGEKISNVLVSVADFSSNSFDMLLGIDFFLSHRIYISNQQHRMFFTYNGGPVFAMSAVAQAQARAGTPAGAAAAAESIDQPKDAASYARRGAASAARLDFQRALADLDRACEMAPAVAEYFVRRGVVHETLKQEAQALQDFDTALQLNPTQPEALMHRAWLRWSQGARAGAAEDLQILDQTLAPQANDRLDMGRLYVKLDLLERAIAQWTLWIAAHEKDIDLDVAMHDRCWARAMLGTEPDLALADCNHAIDRHPRNAAYLSSRAWLNLRRGELRQALADFDRAIQLNGDNAWSFYGRGLVRNKLDGAEAGRADIEAARKLQASIDGEAGRYGLAADSKP